SVSSPNATVSPTVTLDTVRIRLRDVSCAHPSPDKTYSLSLHDALPISTSSATYFLAISASGTVAPENKTGSYTITFADQGVVTADTVREDINSTTPLNICTTPRTIEDFDLSGDPFDGDYFRVSLVAGHP